MPTKPVSCLLVLILEHSQQQVRTILPTIPTSVTEALPIRTYTPTTVHLIALLLLLLDFTRQSFSLIRNVTIILRIYHSVLIVASNYLILWLYLYDGMSTRFLNNLEQREIAADSAASSETSRNRSVFDRNESVDIIDYSLSESGRNMANLIANSMLLERDDHDVIGHDDDDDDGGTHDVIGIGKE